MMKVENAIHQRVKKYSCREVSDMVRDFNLSDSGYNENQVIINGEQYGQNILTKGNKDNIWHRMRRAFVNPFTIILFILASISFVTDVLLAADFKRNVTTTLIIMCMLFISGFVRFIQEMRSKKISDHLTKLVSTNASVRRDGIWREVNSEELVVGDRVRLTAGDCVPADIRLIEVSDLFVSQSGITGESAVLEKNCQILKGQLKDRYTEYSNIAFMGSSIIGGTGEGIVLAVGRDTAYGEIQFFGKNGKNGFEQGANSIAWVLIRFMTILVPIVFIACGITKGDWISSFLFALSVAVGLTPEMLPMVINACLAKGSATMETKETLVKNINAMQELGSMDVLCVDKTGTLTGDTVLLEYYVDILGNESSKVLEYAYLNSLYHTGVQNHLDTAILKCHTMPGKEIYFQSLSQKYSKLDELPFDYERKFVSALVKGDEENLLLIKGSVNEVCERCRYVEYEGRQVEVQPYNLNSVHAVVDEMLEDGMKVLAVAYKKQHSKMVRLEDEKEFILLGYVAFFDAPKQSAVSAIEKLKSLNVNVKVLTGDDKSIAISVCRRLGLGTTIITGRELDNLPEEKVNIVIEQTTIFAELSPRQKARIVKVLQNNGHVVGYLGDGMNDLNSMVQADVGISVENAVEAVQESADVILMKKDLNVLEEGVLEGRKAFANMSKYIKITASSNLGNICSVVFASVFLPFLPMASVQLLLLNLLYDITCLALPWDNVEEDIYSLPREWSGKTLGRFMRFFGPISSVFDIITFGFLYFVVCPAVCGGSFAALNDAGKQLQFIITFQTGWFLESLWTQVLILHLLRTRKIPFLQSRPSKTVLLVTVFGITIFTVMTFTPLGALFNLASLPMYYFGFLLIVVILYMIMVSLAKIYYVRKYHELI